MRSIRVLQHLSAATPALVALFSIGGPVAAHAELTYSWAHPRPQGNGIHDFEFIDAQTGFAVGNKGIVLRTSDAGTSWAIVSDFQAFGVDVHAIQALSNGDLLAAGSSPGLFRSTDQGISWTTVPNPSTGTLFALSQDGSGRLDAAGANGIVIRSTNQGATWTSIGPGFGTIEAQHWASAAIGWVVGDDVAHRTTNSGSTWTQVVDFDPFGFHDIFFSEPNRGFITSDFGYWETANGGSSWTEVNLFTEPLYRKETLVLDAQRWFAIMSGEGAELFETTDEGDSWDRLQSANALGFLDIERLSSGRILVSSTSGDLFYSDDDMQTMTNANQNLDMDEHGPVEAFEQSPNGKLYAVNMLSSGTGETWLESYDGGETWVRPSTSPDLNYVHDIHFPTDDLGLVVAYTQIRRTTDAGATWSSIGLPSEHRGTCFAGDNILYLGTYRVGSGGTVFRSTDEGATWEPRGTGLSSSFNAWAIEFLDDNTGFVSGYGSSGGAAAYRTTNGGASWTAMSVAGLPGPAFAMYWHDPQNGLAASHNYGIYRTTNGGGLWTLASSEPANDLSFRDSGYGVATTSSWNGVLQRTTNGGVTWEELAVPMEGRVTGAIVTDTGFIVGGAETRIMRATDLSPTSVPAEPSLSSAWTLRASPNPTAGATTLSLRVASEGIGSADGVELTVHSTDGRLVRSLPVQSIGNGRFESLWDGRDASGRAVAGGIYFVRWSGANAVSAERIVVIR